MHQFSFLSSVESPVTKRTSYQRRRVSVRTALDKPSIFGDSAV